MRRKGFLFRGLDLVRCFWKFYWYLSNYLIERQGNWKCRQIWLHSELSEIRFFWLMIKISLMIKNLYYFTTYSENWSQFPRFDSTTSSNLEFPYWKHPWFNLENLSNAGCTAEFCFLKSGVYKLAEVLQFPQLIKCYNKSVFDGLECFCVFLKQMQH